MNVIKSMIYEAETKKNQWAKKAQDPEALAAAKKTQAEALHLASYFEGKYDALLEVIKVCDCNTSDKK
jgi:hypothetical protein